MRKFLQEQVKAFLVKVIQYRIQCARKSHNMNIPSERKIARIPETQRVNEEADLVSPDSGEVSEYGLTNVIDFPRRSF